MFAATAIVNATTFSYTSSRARMVLHYMVALYIVWCYTNIHTGMPLH